jgi:hypothetical protein
MAKLEASSSREELLKSGQSTSDYHTLRPATPQALMTEPRAGAAVPYPSKPSFSRLPRSPDERDALEQTYKVLREEVQIREKLKRIEQRLKQKAYKKRKEEERQKLIDKKKKEQYAKAALKVEIKSEPFLL